LRARAGHAPQTTKGAPARAAALAAAPHSVSIITTLAALPDFLRESMLARRLAEFHSMPPGEQREIIDGALAAAPTIPFDALERLLRTWLRAVCALPEDRRRHMFAAYADRICASPERLAALNVDGMLAALLSLGEGERETIARSAGKAIAASPEPCRRTLMLLIPKNARAHVGA